MKEWLSKWDCYTNRPGSLERLHSVREEYVRQHSLDAAEASRLMALRFKQLRDSSVFNENKDFDQSFNLQNLGDIRRLLDLLRQSEIETEDSGGMEDELAIGDSKDEDDSEGDDEDGKSSN
jgi:hypothetical protein